MYTPFISHLFLLKTSFQLIKIVRIAGCSGGRTDMGTVQPPAPSNVNSFRISVAVGRLFAHVRNLRNHSNKNNNDFCNLCLSLSRSIDYAVGNNEIPARASELPVLLKQVCQWANDTKLRAAIMVLMSSLKGACKNGWFSERDNEELYILRNEIATTFCSVRDMNSDESTFHHNITAVMSRFYPGMKMGEILTFVDTMPGCGAYVKDFHVINSAKFSEDEIYLFVAQADNTETSSCIISPQHANFLLNGKAVDMTCGYKDPGPQIPTLVTHMVKYGTNLFQVLGLFKGKYIIVIAFMSMVTNASRPALPDYMPPTAAASDAETDIIEGPSTISLNCPISFRRIKTPVKGYLCKHLQCFDFDNYVGINSRRPSWRCPHCSQSVCFTDIRIDQIMVKVLEEVSVNVSQVKISADGSWEAVNYGDDQTDTPEDKSPSHQESTTSLCVGTDIMDITERGNYMDASNSHRENDRKPSPAQLQNVNMNNVHKSIAPLIENPFWRVQSPTHANRTSNTTHDVTMTVPQNAISQDQSQISASNNTQLPTHATGTSDTKPNVTRMTPVTNTVFNAISQGQSQDFSSTDVQSKQHNSNNMSNGYGGRYPKPVSHITRIPVAVQALPAQTSTVVSGYSQQQFSPSQMDPHQIMSMISASSSQSMCSQNWVHEDHLHFSSQPFQHPITHPSPPQKLNVYRNKSPHLPDHLNSNQQPYLNQMISNSVQPPAKFYEVQEGVVSLTNGLASYKEAQHSIDSAAQQAFGIKSWKPPIPSPLQTLGSSVPVSSSEQQREPCWRPTGRMRGSLSGQAYSDAHNQFIINPTQPLQAATPPVLSTPRPTIPPHLEALMGYNRNVRNYQDPASWC